MGHVGDMWGLQPEATMRLLTSYYNTGQADESFYRYQPMSFKVPLGFPALAKVMLGTGALAALGLVIGVARAARIAHRRRQSSTR